MTEMWPAGRTARLHDLVRQGLSSAAIGREMDVTKNVIIGKCRRMGYRLTQPNHMEKRAVLLGRPLVVRHVPVTDGATLPPLASAVAARKTPKPEPVRKAPGPPVAPPKPRRDEVRGCQWIEGSGSPWQRCGAPVWRYSSWCEEHYRRVYVRRSSPMQPEFAA